MTAFDRIQERMPDLLEELAAPHVPDYFDDLLHQTAGAGQRPSWSSLERWLPMGVIARPALVPRLPVRSLVVVALLVLGLVASLVYLGGGRRTPLPPPFGLARNGVVVFGTASGDIAAWDPASGTTKVLIDGTESDSYPGFTSDGTRLFFARRPNQTQEVVFLAESDGSGVRQFIDSGQTITSFDWAPAGDKALLTRTADGVATISIADAATGRETPIALDPSLGVTGASYMTGRDEILYQSVPDNGGQGTKAWIGPADGSPHLRPIPLSPDATFEVAASPDGSQLVYGTWNPDPALRGLIHVVDLASGSDRVLAFGNPSGTTDFSPRFAPDGKHLVVERWTGPEFRLAIVPSAGGPGSVSVGPAHSRTGADITWAPDASQLIAAYHEDGSVWLLPMSGGDGRQLDEMSQERGVTWQRLAP